MGLKLLRCVLACLALSACYVTSDKPMIERHVDPGFANGMWALVAANPEMRNSYELMVFDVAAPGTVRNFEAWMKENYARAKAGKPKIDLLDRRGESKSAAFAPLRGRPGYFIGQFAYDKWRKKEKDYAYYLFRRDGDRVFVSAMRMDDDEQKAAEEAGVSGVKSGDHGLAVKSRAQLIEYANYWLDVKGRLMDREVITDDEMIIEYRLVVDPAKIAAAARDAMNVSCLIAAGHPEDPDVRALPREISAGRDIGQIKTTEALAKCYRRDLEAAPKSVQYALARVYQARKTFGPVGVHAGSLPIMRRLAEEGHGPGVVGLAAAHMRGHGVARDLDKAKRILEEALPAGDPFIATIVGRSYLFGWFGEKDLEQGRKLIEYGAEKGVRDAMLHLGNIYIQGIGVPKDAERGLGYFAEAAARGLPAGDYKIGEVYYHGLAAIEKNRRRAWQSVIKAARADVTGAQYLAGFMQLYGQGVKENRLAAMNMLRKAGKAGHAGARQLYAERYFDDPSKATPNKEAEAWLKASADGGRGQSQYLLGWLYESGAKRTPDEVGALAYYTKGAKNGHRGAQVAAARIMLDGFGGVAGVRDEAFAYLEAALKQGEGRAGLLLGAIHLEGRHKVKRDFRKAANYYERAAKAGAPDGLYQLGVAYLNGRNGAPRDPKKGVRYVASAAEAGLVQAQLLMGAMLRDGEHVRRDHKKAVNWWLKAARQGSAKAQVAVGVQYQSGKGVKRSYAKAIEWYNKAAKQKHPHAWNNLGLLVQRGQGAKRDLKQAAHFFELAAKAGVQKAKSNLARLLATAMPGLRDGKRALALAKEVAKANDTYFTRETLAAAYAAYKRFREAAIEQTMAIAMAERAGRASPARDFRLQRYRQGKAIYCLKGNERGCFR